MEATTIDRQAEEIYNTHKSDLESKYYGKIVVLDINQEDIAAIGDTPQEASSKAQRLRPRHRFFMRRIGKSPAIMRMR